MSRHGEGNTWQNELLTVKEVAAYLRVSRVTVWRWCQHGTIPAARVGRNWRIHRDDLLHLLERPQSPSSAPVQVCSSPENDGRTPALPAASTEK